MTQPLLVAERVSVVRGQQALLQDVSFSLGAGEIMGLLGANGAGKSTLLSALAGETKLTRGEIRLTGNDLASFTPQSLAEIRAFNAVEPPLAFSLSVFDYVALGQPFADIDCAAILEALERAHAKQWMNRDAVSLSSGELLRVQLARSLYQLGTAQRCIWLLDEPFAHLDLAQRQFALQLLRAVASERNWAMVFSTHEPRDVTSICDSALLLRDGKQVARTIPVDSITNALLTECYGVTIEQWPL